MKIAMLIPDNRDEFKNYSPPVPIFGPAQTALLHGFQQLPECEVHAISCTKQPLRAPPKIAPNIYYHSLLVPKIGWLRGGYILCVLAIRKKLRELQPDIVHGQGTERYPAVAAALSGFPNVITIHGNMRRVAAAGEARPFSFIWLTAKLERFTLPRVGGVICLSTHSRRLVEPLNSRTWLIPNALDDSFFSIPRKPAQPPQIVCVADILKWKNQNILIEALDPIAKTHNFRLRFYGKVVDPREPYASKFLELVAQRPWCEYAGYIDRTKLPSILSEATMLVHPSIEDNCPMAVLEAMAAEVPVAAARIGGVPDLITDGSNGVLFDPMNLDQIRASISKLLGSNKLRAAFAETAKSNAVQRFKPLSVAQQHLGIYREVTFTRSNHPN